MFPLLLYALLGSVYGDEIDGVPAEDVLLAGLIGYGAANTAFAGLAIILVTRRESGVLKRLRATPLPAADLHRGGAALDARHVRTPDARARRARPPRVRREPAGELARASSAR